MAVLMSLAGNSAGDGFLIAPLGTTYDAELLLWTDAGTASVALQASPNPAGLVFSQAAVNLSTTPTIVTVHATLQSASRGDTTIQVLEAAAVVATFTVTSIKHPVVNFSGRFEARFATDGALPFRNPMYTAAMDTIPPPPGWTWGLEGEPNFVPAINNVPENLETTGLGRVIRLNNPVSLRSHAAPVVSTVVSITGETTAGTETFTAGDPLIGQPVDFGPDTYFAGNFNSSSPGSPQPEEYWGAAKEPLGLFQIRLGASFSPPATYFSGSSQVGPFTAKATMLNQHTRTPDSRPIANGLPDATAELAEFGLPVDVAAFTDARIDLLLPEYSAAPDPSPARRNLRRRIGHLLGSASSTKVSAVQATNPEITIRIGTLRMPPPTIWAYKEHYQGKVDIDLHAWPGGPPGGSAVITYMTEFQGFDFHWDAFAFHSDELCGHHKGTLGANLSMHGGHIGDPHTHTVDGTAYDFQAVGEFTLLRNGERMEVQVRQTPVATANPITDSYTDLTACVSINTAVAARVGKHRVSLQPAREGTRLQFYLDGEPAKMPMEGLALGSNRASVFDANGETGLRIDYDDGTVVTATPAFWNAYNVWYIDVGVSNTKADEGVMGFIPKDSWLPRLRDGGSVGPMPASLRDRYVTLYKTFADSWRVTDETSLFVYEPGTSTKAFTDPDWPAERAPCDLKPEFQVPGVGVLEGMPIPEAEMICKVVTTEDLYKNCVFDVATTGDPIFAAGYRFAQDLRLYGTSVRIEGYRPASRQDRSPSPTTDEPSARPDSSLVVTATVTPLTPERSVPTGTVIFYVDGMPMSRPVDLDARGRAQITLTRLKTGEHEIRAMYSGGGKYEYHASSSPNLMHSVESRSDRQYEGKRS
jgi:hypothetical protein